MTLLQRMALTAFLVSSGTALGADTNQAPAQNPNNKKVIQTSPEHCEETGIFLAYQKSCLHIEVVEIREIAAPRPKGTIRYPESPSFPDPNPDRTKPETLVRTYANAVSCQSGNYTTKCTTTSAQIGIRIESITPER